MPVLMFLKLVSLAENTMNAPDLILSFVRRMHTFDCVSSKCLVDFLLEFTGRVEEGMFELIDESSFQLTIDGVGVSPAAKEVVKEVLDFATCIFVPYIEKAKLVHCVQNETHDDGKNGLWLHSPGTSSSRTPHLPVLASARTHTHTHTCATVCCVLDLDRHQHGREAASRRRQKHALRDVGQHTC